MPSVASCCNYPSVSNFLHLVFCIIKFIKITTLSFNIYNNIFELWHSGKDKLVYGVLIKADILFSVTCIS